MFYVNSISGLAGKTKESVMHSGEGEALAVVDDITFTSLYVLKDEAVHSCVDKVSYGKIVYPPPE